MTTVVLPKWLTIAKREPSPTTAGQVDDIVTMLFVDHGGATVSINLTQKEVIVSWGAITASGPGLSSQVFVNDANPDGTRPNWSAL